MFSISGAAVEKETERTGHPRVETGGDLAAEIGDLVTGAETGEGADLETDTGDLGAETDTGGPDLEIDTGEVGPETDTGDLDLVIEGEAEREETEADPGRGPAELQCLPSEVELTQSFTSEM